MRISLKKRIIVFIVLLIMFFQAVPAQAHDAVFLQVLIDTNNIKYVANVTIDKASFFNAESKHKEAQLGNFTTLKIGPNRSNPNVTVEGYDTMKEIRKVGNINPESSNGKEGMPFTFPHIEAKNPKRGGEKNNYTQDDLEQAFYVAETLIPSLNEALKLINKNQNFTSVNELIDLSMKIRNSTFTWKGTTWRAEYKTSGPKYDINNPHKDYATDDNGNYYVKFTNTSTGESYYFVYMVPKGYINVPGAKLANTGIDYSKEGGVSDTAYISWSMLTTQANFAYNAKGLSTSYMGNFNDLSLFEKGMVEFTSNLLNGLRSQLGLYDTEELIYNQGVRGTKAWTAGLMSSNWYNTVMNYHTIFMGVAVLILSLSVVKALIQTNVSTINPMMRFNLINYFQTLLITGFTLVMLIPAIDLFVSFNNRLVSIFASQLPDSGIGIRYSSFSNGFSGVILQIFYFFVALYMNFTYIMRSIILALLIATAPLFVVTMAFGEKYSGIFSSWIRDLLANIFMQSFHALVYAFFMQIQVGTRGIEGFVVLFALIPMTELFRSLVFGSSGGVASRLGMGALTAGAGMVAGAAGGFIYGNVYEQGQPNSSTTFPFRHLSTGGNSGTFNSGPGSGGGGGGGSNPSRGGGSINLGSSSSWGTPMANHSDRIWERQEAATAMAGLGWGVNRIVADGAGVGSGLASTVSDVISGNRKITVDSAGINRGISKGIGALGAMTVGTAQLAMGVGYGMVTGDVNAVRGAGRAFGVGARTAVEGAQGAARDISSSIKTVPTTSAPVIQPETASGSADSTIGAAPDVEIIPAPAYQIPEGHGLNPSQESLMLPGQDFMGEISHNSGVVSILSDRNNNHHVTYDLNKLKENSPQDYANINMYQEIYRNGTHAQKQALKDHGIIGVKQNENGTVLVSYNSTGIRNLASQRTKSPQLHTINVDFQKKSNAEKLIGIDDHLGW